MSSSSWTVAAMDRLTSYRTINALVGKPVDVTRPVNSWIAYSNRSEVSTNLD